MSVPQAPGERALLEDLVRSALEDAAPEELVIFDDTAAEYFRDPDAVLNPKRRDESVGFGLDAALLTPYLLAVAAPVVGFLVDVVVKTVKDETAPVVQDLVRRLFRKVVPSTGAATHAEGARDALTSDQAAEVRRIALSRAADLGLPDPQARLLADSVVGGLVVAG
jgi:hypothetical protein